MRSPPAAKNVATTSTTTKARTAKGSRSASRGIGVPALSVLAARRARSIWARHNATEYESCRGRDLVRDRGGGPMRQAGIAIEPSQTLHAARHAQHQHRRERGRGEQEENAEADGAAGRRQPEPQAEPRER